MRTRITTAIGLAAALAACSKDSDKKEPAKEEPAVKQEPTAKKVETPPPPKKGLAADGNDATTVETVKKVIADCAAQWDDKKGYSWECEPYKAWMEQKPDWIKISATMLNLIEDPDVHVRNLAWKTLSRDAWNANFRAEKERATRIIAAAETETSPAIDGELGVMIAQIELEKLGLLDRVKTLVEKDTTPADFRRGFVTMVFSGSPKSEIGYQMLRAEIARTSDAAQKKELLSALSAAGVHADEVCATWHELWSGEDPALKIEAAARITRGHSGWSFSDPDTGWFTSTSGYGEGPNPCVADVDAVLAHVETLASAGQITDYYLVDALSGPVWDDNASPEHKARALDIAKKVVENTANQNRYGALNLIIQKAPDGKEYARKFEADADQGVKDLALSANKPA